MKIKFNFVLLAISLFLLLSACDISVAQIDDALTKSLGEGSPLTAASIGIKMIKVEGGNVPLSSGYRPRVSTFLMGETEVTQAQWKSVMGSLPTGMRDTDGDPDNNPVNQVSWYDAIVFCNKLSKAEGRTPCYNINGNYDTVTNSTNPNKGLESVQCNWNNNGY